MTSEYRKPISSGGGVNNDAFVVIVRTKSPKSIFLIMRNLIILIDMKSIKIFMSMFSRILRNSIPEVKSGIKITKVK